jgi:diguanylate cyclase (GGDEF)-like protein
MQFDTNTTLITITILLAVVGLQFLVFWTRDRRSPWLGWFGCTFLFAAAGLLVYLVPPKGMEFLTYGGGNALRLAAFAFLWQDARVFSGRRPDLLLVLLPLTIWLALCSVPAVLASTEARVVGSSLFISMFLVLGSWELWRDRHEELPSRYPAIFVYLSFAACGALRIPLVGIAPFPVGAQPVDGTWLAAFGLLAFVHASFLAGFTLSMTRERRELEQRRFALSDPLTGLLNRRAFLDQAATAARRRKGGREPLAVLVLDLDNFKSINDRHGHEAGDQMLQHFANIARATTRSADLLYRMGGEEFCFVLPGATLSEAKLIAERLRTRFSGSGIFAGDTAIGGTVSIGLAAVDHAGFDLELLLAAGDAAVYEAKARGRNQTVVANADALSRPFSPPRAAVA